MSNLNDRAIATPPSATVDQATAWAKKKNASQLMIDLAPFYWEYGQKIGINPVFSYCQTAYESRYLTFRGTLLDATYKNTAGIKRSDEEIKKIMAEKYPNETSSDNVAECHMTFDSWQDSITAQIDHSALYAGLRGYPKKYPEETKDPRHFDWCFGIGKTVLEWAPNYSTNAYGNELLALMDELDNTRTDTTPRVNVSLPVLRSGMYQESPYTTHVKSMQMLLIGKGFTMGQYSADGSFGIATENSLKSYQKSVGITQDGICGIMTWNKLLGN